MGYNQAQIQAAKEIAEQLKLPCTESGNSLTIVALTIAQFQEANALFEHEFFDMTPSFEWRKYPHPENPSENILAAHFYLPFVVPYCDRDSEFEADDYFGMSSTFARNLAQLMTGIPASSWRIPRSGVSSGIEYVELRTRYGNRATLYHDGGQLTFYFNREQVRSTDAFELPEDIGELSWAEWNQNAA